MMMPVLAPERVPLTIEIQIIESELLERLIELFLDKLWGVVVVPELGGDEELITLHDGRNDLLEGSTNLRNDFSMLML